MTLKQLNQKYQEYKKSGLTSLDLSELGGEYYMFYFPKKKIICNKLQSTDEFILPMTHIYHHCKKNNYIFGTTITMSFSIFLISLNGDFVRKFENFLNDIVFHDLKKYKQKTSIGGTDRLDLLYQGTSNDLKYFIIFDKKMDMISIEIYSNLFLNFLNEIQFNDLYTKIKNLICVEGLFLDEEEEEKKTRMNFYKALQDKGWIKIFFFNIFYFNHRLQKEGFYISYLWDKSLLYYVDYLKNTYNLSTLDILEYYNVICNNKTFTRWGILFNKRPLVLSVYKDESLEEVCSIYTGLGISSRFMMNNSFLNGVCKDSLIIDMVLLKENQSVLVKCPLVNKIYSYSIKYGNEKEEEIDSDCKYDNSVFTNYFSFFSLVFYNNYGDITGSIYPDYEKERLISFLSSVRWPSALRPTSLNLCVIPIVTVITTDLYDEFQIFITEKENLYMKKEQNEDDSDLIKLLDENNVNVSTVSEIDKILENYFNDLDSDDW